MNNQKGISRKRFLTGSLALASVGLSSVWQRGHAYANTSQRQAENSGTRLILLGTNGGPRPNLSAPHRPRLSW